MREKKAKFEVKNPESSAPEVDPKDLLPCKDQVHLIDVRRPDEFNGELGHIPGAVLQTLENDFAIFIDEIPEERKKDTFVFVCRSGGRSGQATAYARSKGLVDSYNMSGGMILWNELGFVSDK